MNPDIVSRFSGIGRTLDFKYVSNRLVVYLSLGGLIIGSGIQWLQGRGAAAALFWGFRAAAAVFLAWALARELYPARHPPAASAAGLSLTIICLLGLPDLGLLFWLLIGIRILNRTTGLKPKLFDLMFYALLGLCLVFKGHWTAGLMTVIILLIIGYWDRDKKNYILAAAAAAGIPVLLLFGGKSWIISTFNEAAFGAALIGAALFAPVVIQTNKIQSTGDYNRYHLKPIRVQSAQILAAAYWLQHTALVGSSGLTALFPLYAAGVCSGLYVLFHNAVKKLRK